MSDKKFKLAVIAGDGIGPEVVKQGLRVLDLVASKYQTTFEKEEFDLKKEMGKKLTKVIPEMTPLFKEVKETDTDFIEKQISVYKSIIVTK